MAYPGLEHKRMEQVTEHGTLWDVCLDCGGQWEQDEQVSEGDGWCLDQERED